MSANARDEQAQPTWSASRFFDLLRDLSPLRVISQCGPSTFESICTVGPYGIRDGWLNAITDAYHWHVDLRSFGYVRSRDTTHARSGRRVLFFELRETRQGAPFLYIYVHRARDAAFDRPRERRFAEAHAALAEGAMVGSDATDVDAARA